MLKVNLKISLVIMVLAVISLACGFSATTANIKEAYMASDEAGANRTDVFGQGDTFYCIVQVANAPDDTELKTAWYAVQVQDTAPNTLIDEYSLTTSDATIPFNLTNDSLWPIGTYKVDISLDGEVKQTLNFSVE